MKTLRIILFLARQDLKVVLKERTTLMWLFLMPPVFFFFIGSMTQAGGGFGSDLPSPMVLVNHDEGFLGRQLEARLKENQFELITAAEAGKPLGRLTIPADFTQKVLAQKQVELDYTGNSESLSGDYDFIRVQKSAYTVLGDVLAAAAGKNAGETISEADISIFLGDARTTHLQVTPAGRRALPPSGFEQAIPGTLVMFTLLILLTSGASMLIAERESQLLRRLASAPFSRGQIVAGKWAGRMALAIVQMGFSLIIGAFAFGMDWGESLPMVLAILLAWGALCTSLALLLGSLGKTEGQVSGLGVLTSMILAALGGCWWPVEVAPEWMQRLSVFTPTGWTMDALHKLISFGAGSASALPNLVALLLSALAVGALAARKFRFI